MSVVSVSTSPEARALAGSIQTAVRRHPTVDPWLPGGASDDRNLALDAALRAIGWQDLIADDAWLPYIAPAARELGRGFAPIDSIDGFLGGALRAGDLVRYAGQGDIIVSLVDGGLLRQRAERLQPLGYTDALAVAQVVEASDLAVETGADADRRRAAWLAASVGYLAGLSEEALRLASEHVMAREAFGRPLAALEPVQQQLATAATRTVGMTLLTGEHVDAARLSYVGEAACQVVAICQQVVGAIGYALEFPLQRAFRRSRAVQLWADAALYPQVTNAN